MYDAFVNESACDMWLAIKSKITEYQIIEFVHSVYRKTLMESCKNNRIQQISMFHVNRLLSCSRRDGGGGRSCPL